MWQAHYEIVMKGVYELDGQWADAVFLKDLGPWDRYMTITNDAERVVMELRGVGELKEGQRLFYWDSEHRLDEILIENGRFAGFKPGPLEITFHRNPPPISLSTGHPFPNDPNR